MSRMKIDLAIDTITLETESEAGLIRAGQEVVLRVQTGDSTNSPNFQCVTTAGSVIGNLNRDNLKFLSSSNISDFEARVQTVKRSCDGGLEDIVVRVREKLKSDFLLEGQATQQPCVGPVDNQEEDLDLFTKSELVGMISDDSLKGSLDHRVVKHWVKAVAEAQGSEKQSQLVKEALDDPVVNKFVEHAFKSQDGFT